MSKQVEVPESAICELAATPLPQGVRVLLDYEDEPSEHLPLDAARVLLAEALPAIYKHFSDRLKDDDVRKAATEAAARERSGDGPGCGCDQCLALSTVRAAFAALQATSTPEVDRG